MKYIRTKDGIYEVIEECFKPMENNMVFIPREGLTKILNQADSIEELCDVIVCRNELFYPLTSNREGNEFNWEEINRFRTSVVMSEEEYNKIKETTNDFEPYFWKVFGAIWTDRGLIYVAKMKDVLPNGEIDWESL